MGLILPDRARLPERPGELSAWPRRATLPGL